MEIRHDGAGSEIPGTDEKVQEQYNQMMATMKQRVEEGRNPVTGLPLPARR